jgi:hypothetical protein
MIFDMVLLPDPLAPSSPVILPCRQVKLALERATTPPKCFLMPVASKTVTVFVLFLKKGV